MSILEETCFIQIIEKLLDTTHAKITNKVQNVIKLTVKAYNISELECCIDEAYPDTNHLAKKSKHCLS